MFQASTEKQQAHSTTWSCITRSPNKIWWH